MYKLFTLAALASVVAAAPGGQSDSQCNTGPIQCCNSVQAADSTTVTTLAGLLGIVISDVTALVGLNCNPISVIGVGGNSCTQQPVCCTGNNFNGLIVVGCTPINVNL
ncbi:hydrophobin 2 [Moniliophthora roreri MCA 2997]|uniref:Hydrophobin n=2 Tax=Moniliophthora roreri TaxID=221103 RepID=V2YA65_MONRO|nr:hydrophobin 2 [Moniliophthora roreri MCA 2997]KAI3621385.1 hydrophobin 2 [Moniliophthora roreri]